MPKALLCVTVTAPLTAELRRRRDEAVALGADLVELRLDTVTDINVAGALAGRRGPVIVTCRPQWEGGRFAGSEDERRRILAEAIALGAEFVDVEWRARFDDLISHTKGQRVVLSCHDFDGMPTDLDGLLGSMAATGADVVKVAVKTRALGDCVALQEIGRAFARSGRRHVLIGMGEFGAITRVLPERFGSSWTYAGDQAQVGQLSAAALVNEYRFGAISDTTDLYGLVGLPVSHSVSPAMHNAAFRALDLNAVYLPFPAVTADDFVGFGHAFGIRGVSVTIPHKVSLAACVDDLETSARTVGAINTIRAVERRWIGANTDVAAFLGPLTRRIPLAKTRVSVLGGGGAARAVALGLSSAGATVTVHARHSRQAEDIAGRAQVHVGPYPPPSGSWDVLVNATPVGMYPRTDETPLEPHYLNGRLVYDLVYNPPLTRLLRDASHAGCETIGGLEMLVEQAEQQFVWWTGVRPPAGVMSQAALQRLAEFARDEHHVV